MKKLSLKKALAIALSLCLVMSLCPLQVFAQSYELGDTITKGYGSKQDAAALAADAPEAVAGAVWVITDKIEYCLTVEHTHGDGCIKLCDHALATINGHFQSCYGATWTECSHNGDDSKHTGKVTIDIKNYKDITNANKELLNYINANFSNIFKAWGKTFCYTIDVNNLICTHVCNGDCCERTEHTHTDCYKYTWTLKADVNGNGVADDADTYYTIQYVSEGEVLKSEKVLTGLATPEYKGDTPVKTANAQYTYTFRGWDKEIAATVTADATYTAVYDATVNEYTVIWCDEDETVLETDKNVPYGEMPTFDSETPTKEGTNEVTYFFAGWSPAVDIVKGDITYTATYTEKDVFAVTFNFLYKDAEKAVYVIDGETVAAPEYDRANYTVAGWYTDKELTNEFDFDTAIDSSFTLFAKWVANTDVNEDGIADEEQTNTVKAVAENATAEISEEEAGVNTEVTVTITPDEGYAVEEITVNGEAVEASYKNLAATVTFGVGASTEYVVEAKVVKAALVLKPEAEFDKFGDLTEETVFEAIYDKENSTPNLPAEEVEIKYLAAAIIIPIKYENLGIDYSIPYDYWATPGDDVSVTTIIDKALATVKSSSLISSILGFLGGEAKIKELIINALAENAPHNFGDAETELVKVSFDGNDIYPAMAVEGEIAIVDGRIVTELVLNNATLTFSEEMTAEDVFNAVFVELLAEDEAIEASFEEMEVIVGGFNAGTHSVTVNFKGNREYKNASAQAEITIEKADQTVTIDSAKVKYGAGLNASALIDTGKADRVEIAVGLKLGEDATTDAGAVTYVNIPSLINLDAIENETIKNLINSAFDMLNTDKEMSVSELKETLEKINGVVGGIEDSNLDSLLGFELDSAGIDTAIKVLEQIEGLEFINNLSIRASMGKDVILEDAGAYLIAAVIVDADYNVNANVNYALITPDGYKAELDWIIDDENGLITHTALTDGYDLGAYVYHAYEGTVEEAQEHVVNVFAGIDTNGEFVITDDQTELPVGGFVEVSFLFDIGNTMYYANPIARAFVVVSGLADVIFVDKNGNENNERQFGYDGKAHTMSAVVFDKEGNELDSENIKYYYVGLTTAGEAYYSEEAPVSSGAYTVVAVYISADKTLVGINAGAMAIIPAVPELTVKDAYAIFDGEEKFVDVINPLGLEYISVITDENGNVNIVLPEDWEIEPVTLVDNLREIIAKLELIMKLVPVDYLEQYCASIKEIEATLTKIFETIDFNSASINNALPTEDGIYNVKLIAFGNADYRVAVAEATLEIHEHTYVGTTTTKATCTVEGIVTYVCSECEDTYEVNIGTDKNVHVGKTYAQDENIVAGTCTTVKAWDKVTYCADCDAKLSTVPMSGEKDKNNHTGEKELRDDKKNDCVNDGYTGNIHCNACDAILNYGEVIPATGHTYLSKVTPPTCTANGYTTYVCKCGDTYVADFVNAKDHKYTSEITVPATHTTVGTETFTCACGDTYTKEIAKTPAHTYETKVTAPTCTEKGYTTYTCACGATYDSDFVSANGHKYTSKITTPATLYIEGVETFTCACGDTYTKKLAKLDIKEFEEKPAKIESSFTVVTTGITAADIISQGAEGTIILDMNGKVVDGETALGTGMTVILPDKTEYEIVVYGDVDGDGNVNSADARLALRAAVRLENYKDTSAQYLAANVQKSDTITASDARLILRASVKLEKPEEWIK